MKESQWGPAWVLSALYIPAVPFQKNVLPPCSSGKCHAILSCVGGIAAMVVVKEPQLSNQQEAGRFEKKGIDVQTIHLAQRERERAIKSNRCNRICQIYAQMRGSNNSSTLSQNVKFACGPFFMRHQDGEASFFYSTVHQPCPLDITFIYYLFVFLRKFRKKCNSCLACVHEQHSLSSPTLLCCFLEIVEAQSAAIQTPDQVYQVSATISSVEVRDRPTLCQNTLYSTFI